MRLLPLTPVDVLKKRIQGGKPQNSTTGERRNVLPTRSLGSKVGIGLDPDGFSSSLELMKTVGDFCFGEEPSGYPSSDPEEILSSEWSEDAKS